MPWRIRWRSFLHFYVKDGDCNIKVGATNGSAITYISSVLQNYLRVELVAKALLEDAKRSAFDVAKARRKISP